MIVALIALSCNPDLGSEPGVAWEYARALSDRVRVILICPPHQGSDVIIREKIKDYNLNIFPVFIQFKKTDLLYRFPFNYFIYSEWHRSVRLALGELILTKKIDIIHQINTVGYRNYGGYHKLKKPVVWGPIDGLKNVNASIARGSLGFRGGVYYLFYNLFNSLQLYNSVNLRKGIRNCFVIAATNDAQKVLTDVFKKKSLRIPEIGSFAYVHKTKRDYPDSEFKIVWSGLHIHRKCFPVFLRAISHLDQKIKEKLSIEIIGNGPLHEKWKNMANGLSVKNINWHGWVKREEALLIMNESHLVVVTSIREVTCTVVMEATSLGLPIFVPQLCGMGDWLGANTKSVIPWVGEEAFIRLLANSIGNAVTDRIYYNELISESNASAKRNSMNDHSEKIFGIYKKIIKIKGEY